MLLDIRQEVRAGDGVGQEYIWVDIRYDIKIVMNMRVWKVKVIRR